MNDSKIIEIEASQYAELCKTRGYTHIIFLSIGCRLNDNKYISKEYVAKQTDIRFRYSTTWSIEMRKTYPLPTVVMVHDEGSMHKGKGLYEQLNYILDDTVGIWIPFPKLLEFCKQTSFYKEKAYNKYCFYLPVDDTTDPKPTTPVNLLTNSIGTTATWLTNKGTKQYKPIFESCLKNNMTVKVWGHKYGSAGVYLKMAKENIFGGFTENQIQNMGRYDQKDVPGIMSSIAFHLNLYSKCSWQDSTPRLEYATREAIKYGAVPVVRTSLSMVDGFDPSMAVMIDDNNLDQVGDLISNMSPKVRKVLWSNAYEWWRNHYDAKKLCENLRHQIITSTVKSGM
jgi:hypothetical protein